MHSQPITRQCTNERPGTHHLQDSGLVVLCSAVEAPHHGLDVVSGLLLQVAEEREQQLRRLGASGGDKQLINREGLRAYYG